MDDQRSLTRAEEHDRLLAGLRRPAAYPWPVERVEFVETHISWVFLAGERVLKLKRPVDYGFVDYSTPALRLQACRDEVRLNRLLSEGVYLGVVPITDDAGGVRVDGDGQPLAHATLMRRLPAERMLDRLLRDGAPLPAIVDRLADRLVPFHRTAPPCGTDPATTAAIVDVVIDNLVALEAFAANPLPPVELGLVTTAMRRFVTDRADLLAARTAAGWVREGHGDLRAEHVCVEGDGRDDAVQIIDCVEFSRAIRCADIASDLAFLLMDLDRLGAPELAAGLVVRYRAAGLSLPDDLLRFYRTHRALVRSKVAALSWRSDDLDATNRAAHADQAVAYLHLAASSALTIRPGLIAMTGLSGTGKSTVAAALGRAIGARRLSTDDVRRADAPTDSTAAGWGEGRYRPDRRAGVYRALYELARRRLTQGPVILDGTFLEEERRREAAALAAEAGVPLLFVETIADEETVRRRLAHREAAGDSASEATFAIYLRQRAAFAAAPPGLPSSAALAGVDTTASVLSLDPVLTALRDLGVVDAAIPASGERA